MAGIGFKLEKLLNSGKIKDKLKAYLAGGVITTGPWILSMLMITIFSQIQHATLPLDKIKLFKLSITYIYAGSLIIFGPTQMPLTRYISDQLYLGKITTIIPTLFGALLWTSAICLPIGSILCFGFTNWSTAYKLYCVLVLNIVTLIWMVMIFVGALKDYVWIVKSFVAGTVASILLIIGLHHLGVAGYMAATAFGQFILIGMLIARLTIEFPLKSDISFEFLTYIKKYPRLLAIGALMNLSIWIDKILFWFAPTAEHIDAFLYANPLYDTPIFLAYLTIIPALAIFFVKAETRFYRAYVGFYRSIDTKKNLQTLLDNKGRLQRRLFNNFWDLTKTQGVLSLLFILITPVIIKLAKLTIMHQNILRLGIISTYMYTFCTIMILMTLYFAFQKDALTITIIFFTLNTLITLLTIFWGPAYYGIGLLVASTVSLLLNLIIIDKKLVKLDYLTLSSQPIAS